jgi:hypothetical protein
MNDLLAQFSKNIIEKDVETTKTTTSKNDDNITILIRTNNIKVVTQNMHTTPAENFIEVFYLKFEIPKSFIQYLRPGYDYFLIEEEVENYVSNTIIDNHGHNVQLIINYLSIRLDEIKFLSSYFECSEDTLTKYFTSAEYNSATLYTIILPEYKLIRAKIDLNNYLISSEFEQNKQLLIIDYEYEPYKRIVKKLRKGTAIEYDLLDKPLAKYSFQFSINSNRYSLIRLIYTCFVAKKNRSFGKPNVSFKPIIDKHSRSLETSSHRIKHITRNINTIIYQVIPDILKFEYCLAEFDPDIYILLKSKKVNEELLTKTNKYSNMIILLLLQLIILADTYNIYIREDVEILLNTYNSKSKRGKYKERILNVLGTHFSIYINDRTLFLNLTMILAILNSMIK